MGIDGICLPPGVSSNPHIHLHDAEDILDNNRRSLMLARVSHRSVSSVYQSSYLLSWSYTVYHLSNR